MKTDTFEYIFNNNFNVRTELKSLKSLKYSSNSKKTKLQTKKKPIIKNPPKDAKLFNNTNNNFKNLFNFYKTYNYEHITTLFNKLNNIIVNTENNENKKWIYLSGFLLHNINYYFTYKLSDLIMASNEGINYFIYKMKNTIKFIKNDSNIPESLSYIKNNSDLLIKFENYIQDKDIVLDKYKLYPLTNNKYLSPFVIKIIDIFNRYFPSISSEFNIINFGFYIPNDDKTGNYTKSIKDSLATIKIEMNNVIQTINQYRDEKLITNYEIKYQSEMYKNQTKDEDSASLLNKLNFIITYGYYFTYNNQKLFHYLDKKLIEGGNLILVANMETPIKSTLVRVLISKFRKSIITKATLDDPFNWIFIGKGFISEKSSIDMLKNEDKILDFMTKAFNNSCNLFNHQIENIEKQANLSTSQLIQEINKKYVEIYKWCLNNNIDAINIFADSNKEPSLVDSKNMVHYFFPNQKNVNKQDLKMFDISLYSITLPREANIISETIKKLLQITTNNSMNNMHNIIITDGTANVGGNTLSFSSYFKKVNSIEFDKKTYEGLKHNCDDVYKRKNITFFNGDCTKIIPDLHQDVIFIDPPWNGLFYKAYDKLHLFLGNKDIFDIVSEWYNNKRAKLYCIKCPFNFDFEQFIRNFPNIYIQQLKNWNVIYILT